MNNDTKVMADDDLPGMLHIAMPPKEGEWFRSMDASVWAKEWAETIAKHPTIPTDEGTMIGWFANAIMAGYDEAQRRAARIAARPIAQGGEGQHVGWRIELDAETTRELWALLSQDEGQTADGFAPITLRHGDGHSGRGYYASYTDYPDEGATFLGKSMHMQQAWVNKIQADPEPDLPVMGGKLHPAPEPAKAEAVAPVRMFPIMGWRPIPWSVLEPREDWAQRNHSQSLFTLAQRGGLSPSEAVAIIEGRRWHRMDKAEAEKRLAELAAPTPPAAGVGTEVTDKALLDFLADEHCDLRCFDIPTGAGDADVGWRVVKHYMAQPQERTVAEVFHDDPRAALTAALSAQGAK